MKEKVIQFGKGNDLVGILTSPSNDAVKKDNPVFIFLNSGFIHRVGISRVHVTIARELAQMGFFSFRMDSSGIGDSLTSNDALSIDQRWVNETREAMDSISAATSLENFVLVGNCSGAELSFKTACIDQRVISAVLINPESNKIPLQYYIRLAIRMPALWIRFIKGNLKIRNTIQKHFRLKAIAEEKKKSEPMGIQVQDLLKISMRWYKEGASSC